MSALKVWVAAKHEGDQLVLAHLYLGPELVLAEMEMGQELLQLVLDLRRFMKRAFLYLSIYLSVHERRKFQSL